MTDAAGGGRGRAEGIPGFGMGGPFPSTLIGHMALSADSKILFGIRIPKKAAGRQRARLVEELTISVNDFFT
jgi:hypothetical protein